MDARGFDVGVFGVIVADLLTSPMDLRHPPAPGALVEVQRIELATGGNVPNCAIAMARLGMRVAAAGMVGSDILGEACLKRLRDEGVDVSAVGQSPSAQTSATVVAVEPGGERCFFHAPGANALLTPEVFRGCFGLFAQCSVLHIGYFGLLPALTPALPGLLRELKAASPMLQVSLDTLNPPAPWAMLEPILPWVDIFVPSRSEARALLGAGRPEQHIDALRRLMPRALLGVKLDADGCLLDNASTRVHCPAYPVSVVDTTGAGDTWYGGLLCGLRRSMPLEQAGRLANRVAANCCSAFGASAGLRDLAQTLARL